jgi:HlyD family secretion protein
MKLNKIEEAEMMHKLGIDPSQSRWKKWKWIIFGAMLIFVIAAVVISRNNADKGVELQHFKTKEIAYGPLTVTVTATGTLKPTRQVDVGSELSGILKTVDAQYNDHVKAGQVLATLDGSLYEAQVMNSKASLESAQADVLNSKATVKEARSKLDRLEEVWKLSGNKVPSKTDLDAAEATLQRAQASLATTNARVSQAQATLDRDQTNISKLVIRSPIDGIVLNRAYEPGQTVQASFQGVTLFTLAEDLSRMELHVDVDEADVGDVKDNQEATFTVDGYPDKTFKAHITQVRYGSKTVSGVVTYETVLNVDNSELLLRPGMTATADIVVHKLEKVMLIDNAALRFTPSEKDLGNYSGQKQGFFKKLFPGSTKVKTEEKDAKATEAVNKNAKKVWLLRENILVPVTITTGLTDGIVTEVTGGELKNGVPVITGTASTTK